MSQTAADLLSKTEDAIARLLDGAQMVTINGQQYMFSHLSELMDARKKLTLEVAADAGTDGRGAWEAAFDE